MKYAYASSSTPSNRENELPKLRPTDPDFYLRLINKFGTEENKEKAKKMITKQYLERNFYRTKMCKWTFFKETNPVYSEYLRKSNWKVGEPDENSNWVATQKNTGTQKCFRLCVDKLNLVDPFYKDLCKDAHHESFKRKAKCIFNAFGVCDKGDECSFDHSVSNPEFKSDECNIPLCVGKEFKHPVNGQKLFKAFFYLNSIRIFKYAEKKENERTFVLNIDNGHFTETDTNTESNIQNRIQQFYELLTIYHGELESIFGNKNELSATLFLDSIIQNVLKISNQMIFLFDDLTFNTVSNFYMSNTSFSFKIQHLIGEFKNEAPFFKAVSIIVQMTNLLPEYNNDIMFYRNNRHVSQQVEEKSEEKDCEQQVEEKSEEKDCEQQVEEKSREQYIKQKGNEMYIKLNSDPYYEIIKPYIGKIIGMWIEHFDVYLLPALEDEKFLVDAINEALEVSEVDLKLNYKNSDKKEVESFESINDEILPREHNVVSPIKDLENEIDVDSGNVQIQVEEKVEVKSDNVNTQVDKLAQSDNLESKGKTKFLISVEIEISANSLTELQNIGKQLQAIKGVKVPSSFYE